MATNVKKPKTRSYDATLDYTLGTLSPARHAIIACQREISETVHEDIDFQEQIASSLMMKNKGVALKSDFFEKFLEQIDDIEVANADDEYDVETLADISSSIAKGQKLDALQNICGQKLSDINWKSVAPGIAKFDIIGDRKSKGQERLYLLRAKGGMKMPEHSHHGEEWTLLLTGGYEAQGVSYQRGDLHISGDQDAHAPHINEGEDCICLVMTNAPLEMKGIVPRLLQPFIGL